MEYNKKEGIGKKFVEGLLVSVVIMGLFFLLQLLLGSVSVLAAVTACILQTWIFRRRSAPPYRFSWTVIS